MTEGSESAARGTTADAGAEGRPAVALVGAGNMGGAIGRRLLACGHRLAVFDPDASARRALVELGASECEDAAGAAATARFTILSLNAAGIVERAAFGERGVVAGAPAGGIVIDMSSIDPVATRAFAARASEAGLRWLDCPLSGGAPKAVTGELAVFAGGDAEGLRAARAVLDSLSDNCTHLGDSGAGQTVKLINQVLAASTLLAVAEAVSLARAAGVDAARLPAALAGGRADGAILREYVPKMAGDDRAPTGRLDNMLKDLDAALALGARLEAPLPVTTLCAGVHRRLVERGLGDRDLAELVRHYDDPDAPDGDPPC